MKIANISTCVFGICALSFCASLFTTGAAHQGTSANNSSVPNMLGSWSISANNHRSTLDITSQNGVNFSGKAFTENLANGRISGNRVTFTRQWGSGSLRQDYSGTLTVNPNGTMTMRGTFTQNGKGSYNWTATSQRAAGFTSPTEQTSTPHQTSANSQSIVYMSGNWTINANGHNSTIKITNQNDGYFTGKVFTENLVNGRLSGRNVTFTRMWSSGNLRQDYTGTVIVHPNGLLEMEGTFTQNGKGSYRWSAVKQQGQNKGYTASEQQTPARTQDVPDMLGSWSISANNHRSTLDITSQNGVNFSGKAFTENLANGRISGNRVTFTRQWGSGSLRQDYTGTLTVNPNGTMTMRGTFTQNGKGSYNWTATKK